MAKRRKSRVKRRKAAPKRAKAAARAARTAKRRADTSVNALVILVAIAILFAAGYLYQRHTNANAPPPAAAQMEKK